MVNGLFGQIEAKVSLEVQVEDILPGTATQWAGFDLKKVDILKRKDTSDLLPLNL